MKRNYPTRAEHNAKMRMSKRHIELERQLTQQWHEKQMQHRSLWQRFLDFLGL